MSGRLQSWRLVDPTDTNPATREYIFRPNPRRMTSPFPERAITTRKSSAPGGRSMVWEGPLPDTEWSFTGSALDKAQYEALRKWVYDRPGHVYVYDHFGRRMDCVLKAFQPEPPERMKSGKYWYHVYTIKATVFGMPTTPTVGESGR